jgi:hypothetical protein
VRLLVHASSRQASALDNAGETLSGVASLVGNLNKLLNVDASFEHRFSSSRPAHERKIDDRVARNDVRRISIGD